MAGVPSVSPSSEQTGEVVQQKIYTAEVVHNREELNQIGMTITGHYILTEQIALLNKVLNVAPCLCFLAAAFENFPFE